MPTSVCSIISTGHGRLHLVKSADYISQAGVDIRLIQGWIPRYWPTPVLNLLGRVLGSPNLAYGLRQRWPLHIPPQNVLSCGRAEFFIQGLFLLSRLHILDRSRAASCGWRYFGKTSRKFLKTADIFHVRSGAGQGGAIAEARRQGMRVVVDHSIAHPAFMERQLKGEFERHGIPFRMGPSDPLWSLVLKDCAEADTLLVNSDFVRETFIAEGYPPGKIHVAYLGVRRDFQGLKSDYAIGPCVKLLFTGGFGVRKGAEYLLRALQVLATGKKKGVTLEVVGTAAEGLPLAKALKVHQDLVRFSGHVPQDALKTYLATSDIYVFPSLSEGCASSGMEAMAAGLPVIATKESGLPIDHGIDGWIVPSKDPEAVGDAVTRLSCDQALREHLGRNASKKIAGDFSWESYGRNVADIYRQTLAG